MNKHACSLPVLYSEGRLEINGFLLKNLWEQLVHTRINSSRFYTGNIQTYPLRHLTFLIRFRKISKMVFKTTGGTFSQVASLGTPLIRINLDNACQFSSNQILKPLVAIFLLPNSVLWLAESSHWTIYTANSIKVVLKKREKVEYERERLVGND